MKLHNTLLVTLICLLPFITSSVAHDATDTDTDKPIIIFDLLNVLFKENYAGFAERVGYATLAGYALTHWRNPGHRCLDMLHEISKLDDQNPHVTISIEKRTLPKCLVNLHENSASCEETKKIITECVEILDEAKYFSSKTEKKLMLNIMELVLDPSVTCAITEPIPSMVNLVKKLNAAGYKTYLLANSPQESYIQLREAHPDIFNLFDGTVISSDIGCAKPDKQIFQHLLDKYSLDPNKCILIDDLDSSIKTAEELGIQGIPHQKTSTLIKKLKGMGAAI